MCAPGRGCGSPSKMVFSHGVCCWGWSEHPAGHLWPGAEVLSQAGAALLPYRDLLQRRAHRSPFGRYSQARG